jgi:carbonic anhydrase
LPSFFTFKAILFCVIVILLIAIVNVYICTMENNYEALLKGNKEWVSETNALNPDFFKNLAVGQNPEFLWIGCSDSRVPATEITKTKPGSIFVHRNIANIVVHTDANVLSVVYYAVRALKVKHIIVCGHYGCGGVIAAMSDSKFGFLDNWLTHIKDVYRLHQHELDSIVDKTKRADRLVELNVTEQVLNLSKVNFIQEAWEEGEFPHIHGWVYDVKDGLINDLKISINNSQSLHPVYSIDSKKQVL